MNPMIQLKKTAPLLLITLTLHCFALLPQAPAVVPPPDGGYPGQNTAEGQNALFSLTTGTANTAVGWFSLRSNTDGSFNTAVGAGTLPSPMSASRNTAIGAAALFSDTTGFKNTANGALALFSNTSGCFNTATGDGALFNNTGGGDNTATGYNALAFNTTGSENMAIGAAALVSNTEGVSNTASGFGALFSNTTGSENTATGVLALYSNVDGVLNTAIGYLALRNNDTGDNNTAIGNSALFSNVGNLGRNNTAIGAGALSNNTAGQGNIALGRDAGINVTTASNVICIGHPGQNMSNRCYIGNIFTNGIFGVNVEIDGTGQIGVPPSSRRFKNEIKPMDSASEAILALKPVTFHYKSDTTWTRQFGLIAEEVEKVNPDLIVRDKDGKPYSVRYDQVNAMLLNEFLKEHRKVEQQRKDFEAALTQQQKQIEALAAGLQKVSAQLQLSKSAPQTVLNNQ